MHGRHFGLTAGMVFLVLGIGGLSGCRQRQSSSSTAPGAEQPAAHQGGPGQGEEALQGVYGCQDDEEILPADPTLPDTLLRGRALDTCYHLSNAHIGPSQFGMPKLFVDYEKVKIGEQDGVAVQIHVGDGSRRTVLVLGGLQTHGTLDIGPWPQGFGPPSFPKDMEIYLTHTDERYGPQNVPVFKVSNSVIVGTMTHRTSARDWTKEEIARLTKPPPNYQNPNAHADEGADTSFAGDASFAAFPKRLVEPGGLLLGLEYRPGDWMGEKGIWQVVPIFHADQPATYQDRILARDGYAVGALKVQSKRFVDALQLVFMRVKDGRLDPSDSYTSDWFGNPGQEAPKTLSGEGKRVIGIDCHQGAVLFAIALVLEGKASPQP